jgi:large subunit ribosomal protein L9
MKLILTREVGNLGSPGDIVEVKDGYGRNYLVPQGMAIAWSRGAAKQIQQIRRAREVRQVRDLGHARELKAELEALSVSVSAKAGDSGHLFGSVSDRDVATAIKKAGGPDIDWHRIDVGTHIKEVGSYDVGVDLHGDVTATVRVEVVPE